MARARGSVWRKLHHYRALTPPKYYNMLKDMSQVWQVWLQKVAMCTWQIYLWFILNLSESYVNIGFSATVGLVQAILHSARGVVFGSTLPSSRTPITQCVSKGWLRDLGWYRSAQNRRGESQRGHIESPSVWRCLDTPRAVCRWFRKKAQVIFCSGETWIAQCLYSNLSMWERWASLSFSSPSWKENL